MVSGCVLTIDVGRIGQFEQLHAYELQKQKMVDEGSINADSDWIKFIFRVDGAELYFQPSAAAPEDWGWCLDPPAEGVGDIETKSSAGLRFLYEQLLKQQAMTEAGR